MWDPWLPRSGDYWVLHGRGECRIWYCCGHVSVLRLKSHNTLDGHQDITYAYKYILEQSITTVISAVAEQGECWMNVLSCQSWTVPPHLCISWYDSLCSLPRDQSNILSGLLHTGNRLIKPHSLLAHVCRWSAGVIMYTLLAGSPPFWHRKQMLMLRMILAGNYDFSSPEWEDRSDTVKDLVSFC